MIKYVALGSVVLLKGATQKMLIISRALNVKNGQETFFFDYGAVPYPDGLVSDRMAYFNHENISNVIFEGYTDAENENMVVNINVYLEKHPELKRGNPETWKA